MVCSSTTTPKVMFPYAIVQHYIVKYADVQHEWVDTREMRQDAIHSTVHECTQWYNRIPWCPRSYSTNECRQVRVGTTWVSVYERESNYVYTEFQCKIATTTQYRSARTHYVRSISRINARLDVFRGQLYSTEFYLFFPCGFYFAKVPRVGRLLTHDPGTA